MSERERRRGERRSASPADPAGAAARRARGMRRLRRRRIRWWAWRGLTGSAMIAVAMAAHFSSDGFASMEAPIELAAAERPLEPVLMAGALVSAELRPPPAPETPKLDTRPKSKLWWKARTTRAAPGESIEVSLTAYCLKGTTRRDNYVRQGIVASDPRVFPLGRYVEVYVGKNYLGRFLVDDTGGVIKGAILDIWTPTCRQARLFGRQKGTAILVPRNAGPAPTPDVTELMSYVKRGRGAPRPGSAIPVPAAARSMGAPAPHSTPAESLLVMPKAGAAPADSVKP